MKLQLVRVTAIVIVIALFSPISSAHAIGPTKIRYETGTIWAGHPATYPYGITETGFQLYDCQKSPWQGTDGWAIDLGTGYDRYSIVASAHYMASWVNVVFYEPYRQGCRYHSGHWWVGLPLQNQPIPYEARWMVISFPSAAKVTFSATWWSLY